MTRRFRVFGTSAAEPRPAVLLEQLQALCAGATGHFRGDDQGWFEAELVGDATRVGLQRFLATEEGIRGELNTWAAWLETAEDSPHRGRLMQHMIGTAQLFVVEETSGATDEDLCVGVCRFLARETAGVYQVDDQGFFEADGTLLLRE
jgi:hypothetical protein